VVAAVIYHRFSPNRRTHSHIVALARAISFFLTRISFFHLFRNAIMRHNNEDENAERILDGGIKNKVPFANNEVYQKGFSAFCLSFFSK
jgi:hypothetical protein